MRRTNNPTYNHNDRPIKPTKNGKYNLDFIDWNNEWERASEIACKLERGEDVSDEEEARRVEQDLQIHREKYGIKIDKFVKVTKVDITKECYICLKNFDKVSKIRKLPCSHMFCEECLKPWIKTNRVCPTCRASLKKEDEDLDEGVYS